MFERTLRIVAIVLSAVVALGFILFVIEDADRASGRTVDEISSSQQVDPPPAGERVREQRHSKLREAVDDANDVLLKPFAGIADSSSSRWVQRGVPALLGLLVYGFGLGFLARFTRGRG